MARLNEPATQIDSVEALKRRFVRQNREIARVNSTQSLRIRNLESDVSRLLSENITLREEVIRLQLHIDNNIGSESIDTVRQKLETKLGELGNLVNELGNLPQSVESRRAIRRKSGVKVSPKMSPDQRNWKNALTISEVTNGADGRLPPIVEGKYYPRKTLDADDLLKLLPEFGGAADSPDLGPPPIAHFEAGDPIQFNASQQESPRKTGQDSGGVLNPALLPNLETRRKRRESSRPGENTILELTDSQTMQQERINGASKPEHTLKSGAKRKFSAREEDEPLEFPGTSEREDFEYNRTQENPQPKRTGEPSEQTEKRPGQSSKSEDTRTKEHSREKLKVNPNQALATRNVLAPKSVNTDPVSSPVKIGRLAEGEKIKVLKPDMPSKPRDRTKPREQPASQRFARPAKMRQAEAQASESKSTTQNVTEISKVPSETSAPSSLDTFSPDGSEPPAARPESRDTPPPADLDPETANTNTFGSMGRASRRPRGSVSYAEPNLRDKMRRPTKDLVDAVAAEERMQQKRTIKNEGDATEAEPVVTGEAPSKMRTVTIKKEPTADYGLDWKALPMEKGESDRNSIGAEPPSPLSNKAPAAKTSLPPSVVTERRRRPSMLERDRSSAECEQQGSGAGSTIAALITEHPKHRPRGESGPVDKLKLTSKHSETPEVYDIQGSSPADTEDTAAKARESKATVARSSRRHSSVSDDRIKDAMARRERRKETAPAPDLKGVRSAATLVTNTGEAVPGRGERAASRRRSMML